MTSDRGVALNAMSNLLHSRMILCIAGEDVEKSKYFSIFSDLSSGLQTYSIETLRGSLEVRFAKLISRS